MDKRSGVPRLDDDLDKLSSEEPQSELERSRIGLSYKRQWRAFSVLYLLSLAVFAAWLVVVLIGIVQPQVWAFEDRIDLPIGLVSIVCLEVFMRLARRAKKKWVAHAPKD